MKALIIAPFIMLMILGFALELNSIAEDAAAQTIDFATNMNNALPCASKGIPINVCSPELAATDFSDITARYQATLEDINKTTSPIRDALIEELESGTTLEDLELHCTYDENTQEIICTSE